MNISLPEWIWQAKSKLVGCHYNGLPKVVQVQEVSDIYMEIDALQKFLRVFPKNKLLATPELRQHFGSCRYDSPKSSKALAT